MAQPRVFVSSTCYDLQEVRNQLKSFIEDFGFNAVLSEYGDIFYDYTENVQDACLNEINKCDLFLLIIGNNYGSLYHREKSDNVPDSVTLAEFKKAVEVNIYKHIFINRFVDYDYKNYKKKLLEYISDHIEKSKVILDEEKLKKLRANFDIKYPFPQESYRFIFHFLDIVYEQKLNNATIAFESFNDIRDMLKKQWASVFYDYLTQKDSVSLDELTEVKEKLFVIDDKLNRLVNSLGGDTDEKKKSINSILDSISYEDLNQLKENIFENLNEILITVLNSRIYKRIVFYEKWNEQKTKEWLNNLEAVLNKYKWSKTISITTLFNYNITKIDFGYLKTYQEVDYNCILKFNKAYTAIKTTYDDDDLISFVYTVSEELNKQFQVKEKKSDIIETVDDEDMPF